MSLAVSGLSAAPAFLGVTLAGRWHTVPPKSTCGPFLLSWPVTCFSTAGAAALAQPQQPGPRRQLCTDLSHPTGRVLKIAPGAKQTAQAFLGSEPLCLVLRVVGESPPSASLPPASLDLPVTDAPIPASRTSRITLEHTPTHSLGSVCQGPFQGSENPLDP